MKKTAVEWLVENLKEVLPEVEQYALLIGLAKEMEKEQIMNAYLKNHLQGCWMKNKPEEYAEQYYNEIYKQDEQNK